MGAGLVLNEYGCRSGRASRRGGTGSAARCVLDDLDEIVICEPRETVQYLT